MLPTTFSSVSAPISLKRKLSTSPTPSPTSTHGTAWPSPCEPFPARTSLPKGPPPSPSQLLLFFVRRGITPAVLLRTSFEGQAMVVLFVLFGSLLFCRALGALGVSVFDSWPASTRFALAVMFLFTSSAHFNKF